MCGSAADTVLAGAEAVEPWTAASVKTMSELIFAWAGGAPAPRKVADVARMAETAVATRRRDVCER